MSNPKEAAGRIVGVVARLLLSGTPGYALLSGSVLGSPSILNKVKPKLEAKLSSIIFSSCGPLISPVFPVTPTAPPTPPTEDTGN